MTLSVLSPRAKGSEIFDKIHKETLNRIMMNLAEMNDSLPELLDEKISGNYGDHLIRFK
jgi:hypothetical protein